MVNGDHLRAASGPRSQLGQGYLRIVYPQFAQGKGVFECTTGAAVPVAFDVAAGVVLFGLAGILFPSGLSRWTSVIGNAEVRLRR